MAGGAIGGRGTGSIARQGVRWVLLVSLAWAVSGCWWTQVGSGPGRAFDDRFEPTLTARSVGALSELWSAPMAEPPIIAQGAVYGVEPGAALTARDVHTGAVRWTRPMPVQHATAPAYHRGFVYVAGYDVEQFCPPEEPFCSFTFLRSGLYSFDARTGEPGPVVAMPTLAAGPPAFTPTEAIVPGGVPAPRDPSVEGVSNVWIHPWSGSPADHVFSVPFQPTGTAPVIDAARRLLITPSTSGGVEALSLDCTDPCAPTWTHPTNGGARVLASTRTAVVIVVLTAQNLRALDPSTGDPLYEGEVDGPGRAAVRGTSVWIDDESLLAMHADCGQDLCPPVWRGSAVVTGQPVLGGELVYVPSLTPEDENDTAVFRAAGCGQSFCDPLARLPVAGALVVGDGIVAATAAGETHVLGIP